MHATIFAIPGRRAVLGAAAGACVASAALAASPEADANGDGRVTRAEFMAWAGPMVLGLDTDRDSRVSSSEWAKGAARLPGGFATRGYPSMGQVGQASFFPRVDSNGDGYLTAAEVDAMAAETFARYDANHDGVLAGAELDEIRSQASR